VKIKIYGARGSSPSFNNNCHAYGGNTACISVDTGGRTILLDAGTGLAQFANEMKGEKLSCDILISHLHLDHILGLLNFAQIFNPQNDIRIFTKSRADTPLEEQIFGAFKPPYWPVNFSDLCKAKSCVIFDDVPFMLDSKIKVTAFKSEHPNDTSAFRIDSDKSLVYLVDYEIDEKVRYEELVGFCENADLIILDTAYLPEDYPPRRGWGHSTYEMGMTLAERCKCKKMMFFHFAQDYSGETLDALAEKIESDRFILAREGMEFEI
jgi:ribonuclease BN (tRNA processing enzyme)